MIVIRLDEKTTSATKILENAFFASMALMGINAKNVPLILVQIQCLLMAQLLMMMSNALNVMLASMGTTAIKVDTKCNI